MRAYIREKRATMSDNTEEETDALEEFLSGRSLDPERLGDPPLADGEDALLTRERVSFNTDDE